MGSVPGQTKNTQALVSAFSTAIETTGDDAWFADSGASNQVTMDAQNLQQGVEYIGKTKLMVGDGTKLEIKHIGESSIPVVNNRFLTLKNILHVPHITRNLLSISKLTADNDIFIEFHANCCLVKDRVTGKVLLEGVLEDGLYKLNQPSISTTYNSQAQTTSTSTLQIQSRSPINCVVESYSPVHLCKSTSRPPDAELELADNLQYDQGNERAELFTENRGGSVSVADGLLVRIDNLDGEYKEQSPFTTEKL
ncbi:Uncharacterized protein Adt_46191 [Abeliophyllum distichum]|uniref:Retrovirus-related Pol polyprotein from transposon TNT 1-94-like beta-barrel domain-containing protein n=1 Tax=Abeliophyllum distichum TaxID=126358 RepID=A0ABD1P2E3_9LAMI